MPFRFWRRIRLLPGVTLNLSKSTASLSFGPRGAKYTISPRGNRATAGLPGTGLFYTVRAPAADRAAARPEIPAHQRLSLGFFRRLVTPRAEAAFVDGLRAVHEGDIAAARAAFATAPEQPDATWMAAVIAMHEGELDAAERDLRAALAAPDLGALYRKYDVVPTVSLPVTDEITAHVGPRRRGTLLALAQLLEARGAQREARQTLETLCADLPDDVVVRAALADLLVGAAPIPTADAEAAVALAGDIANEMPAHAALLLSKGRALRALGLDHAAMTIFTAAYRRKKDRPATLLRQIRYERALAYLGVGYTTRARRELEAIYAEAPDFEDVRARLGLGDRTAPAQRAATGSGSR